MFSILIVDDEEWTRLGIISKLKKSCYDFRYILQESNAEQALETASVKRPDIVLCDIRMVGMDGLVFSRKLLEFLPDTKIVIISGYNDFAYAKEAIRLGVVDYLLKPIDNTSLYQSLEKCIRQIELNHQHRSALTAVKKAQQRNILRSTAAEILAQTKPDYSRLFTAYNGGGVFQAYYLYVDISSSLSADVLDEHLSRQFHEFVLGDNLIYYENQCNEFLIVLYYPSEMRYLNPDTFVRALESSLYTEIHYITPYQYTFGISAACPDFSTAIHEALFCMKHRILCTNKNIIQPDDIVSFATGKFDVSFLTEFKEVVCHQDKKRLDSTLKAMYRSIEKGPVSYEALQNLYLRILVLLGEYMSFPLTQSLQMPTEIYYFSSVWDWIDFLKELLTRSFENDKPITKESDPRLELIEDIKCYIQENYSKKLSLSDIAQQKHINYCYLSLLFKEVAKVTFQDYLMEIRLNHACSLLQTGKYKIKDVAELSGFSDQHYFSKTFKKITGHTPKEYLLTHQDSTIPINGNTVK